jgi:alkylation response protein AidB-like acyl-CoA dehydrogenase
MQLDFSTSERQFRDSVRTWAAANKPKERRPVRGTGVREFDLAWQKAKFDGGFGAVSWPSEYGGAGLSPVEQLIWFEELARADAPGVGSLSPALNHAGPTLIARADEAQKSFHLPKILRGEVVWSQGFSEPQAGSDLGGLRLKGEVDGDDLVINGQKIWTSYGQFADYQETLVRTEPGIGKHKGISWVIFDMKSPGIDIRPLNTIGGEQHFCEVFYDNVRIPLSNVVGGLNNGWGVAMGTLTTERGAAAASHGAAVGRYVEQLVELAKSRIGPNGRSLYSDDAIGQRLARLRAEAAALRAMTYAVISRAIRGADHGPESTLPFLYFGELLQRVRLAGLEILGGEMMELDGAHEEWSRTFLADRAYVIGGGSAEIRRNIIAQTVLGLPRSY